MNREILFRGKRTDNGEWAQGFYMESILREKKYFIVADLLSKEILAVDPATVGQFTDLLDKEGNKIFEGDVLRSVHFKEGNKTHYLYHIVKWDNRLSGWIAQNIDTRNGNFTDQGNPQIWVYIKNVDFDIMGPIHDHPHLLNKQTSNQ